MNVLGDYFSESCPAIYSIKLLGETKAQQLLPSLVNMAEKSKNKSTILAQSLKSRTSGSSKAKAQMYPLLQKMYVPQLAGNLYTVK